MSAEFDRGFYEGKWTERNTSSGSLRNWLVKKERFFLRELRGKRGKVLDLGCGGGWQLYTRVGPVVGIDLSHASLQQAGRLYAGVAQARLEALPFADDSFDFVVSSDVLGHVRFEDKPKVLAEIRRVLKPGGLTMHYIEAEGTDPLMNWARRHPDLYARHVLEPEGHIGLERASAIFERFRRAGFWPVEEVAAYRGVMYPGRLQQQFDNEYAQRSRLLRLALAVVKTIRCWPILELLANLVTTVQIEIVDHLFPTDWAGGVLVVYE